MQEPKLSKLDNDQGTIILKVQDRLSTCRGTCNMQKILLGVKVEITFGSQKALPGDGLHIWYFFS